MATGRASLPTPAGIFHGNYKVRDSWSVPYKGLDAVGRVRVSTGGDAFHEDPVTVRSHGCVHLSASNAEYFYNFLQIGDEVPGRLTERRPGDGPGRYPFFVTPDQRRRSQRHRSSAAVPPATSSSTGTPSQAVRYQAETTATANCSTTRPIVAEPGTGTTGGALSPRSPQAVPNSEVRQTSRTVTRMASSGE